eukprot:11275962-Karenia_brevis.AAC.1
MTGIIADGIDGLTESENTITTSLLIGNNGDHGANLITMLPLQNAVNNVRKSGIMPDGSTMGA